MSGAKSRSARQEPSNLRERVQKIAAVQGVIFLKDLLREKKRAGQPVTLGGTKQEVLTNLLDAVDQGIVDERDFQNWLDRTEGWGRQHVYLYRLTNTMRRSACWRSVEAFDKHLRASKIRKPDPSKQWHVDQKNLKLVELSFDGVRFQAKWHQANLDPQRDASLDFTAEVDGDEVVYQAWRRVPVRQVVRMILLPKAGRAALFSQIPLGDGHRLAREMVFDSLGRFLPMTQLTSISIGDAIKSLDQQTLDAGDAAVIHPQQTRLRARGASVEFRAEAGLTDYMEIAAVRRVRQSVMPGDFEGDVARFKLDLKGEGLVRTVQMSLVGPQDRIYLFAKMTAQEVWAVLDPIYPQEQVRAARS